MEPCDTCGKLTDQRYADRPCCALCRRSSIDFAILHLSAGELLRDPSPEWTRAERIYITLTCAQSEGIDAVLGAFNFTADAFGLIDDGRSYERPDDDNPRAAVELRELITRADGSGLPTSLDDVCTVRSVVWETGEGNDQLTRATLREILTALADPSDEYYLLDLRLENGFGREAR